MSFENSPLISKGKNRELKLHLKYRTQYEDDLKQLLEEKPSDTIFLVENYEEICFGCPANFVQVYTGGKLITYKTEDYKTYKKEISYLEQYLFDSSGYWYKDIYELRLEMRKGNVWNQNPEKYAGQCLGVGGSFYTVLYPSSKIESMYITCWLPEEFRKNN